MKRFILFFLFSLVSCHSYAQPACTSPVIQGTLTYDNAYQTPLQSCLVFLELSNGSVIDSCYTDITGNFRFCNLAFGTFQLRLSTPDTWGGVDATDALIALLHFTQGYNLNTLRLRAADVNASQYINVSDALAILKRFAHVSTSFNIQDWLFDEITVEIYDTIVINVNLHGICAGDLNGSFNPFLQTFASCGDTLTDQRDMQKYPTVQIGSQCWMQKNLNIGSMVLSTITSSPHSDCCLNDIIEKYCYNNDSALCDVYGGLYDWDELMQYDTIEGIQGICPDGWHIPTDGEWCIMISFLDVTINCNSLQYTGEEAGGKLKESGFEHWRTPNTGATNESGFTALGGGYRGFNGIFGTIKEYMTFYTSSSFDAYHNFGWIVKYNKSQVGRGKNMHEVGNAVRCIKN